jgi:hypothetical protein
MYKRTKNKIKVLLIETICTSSALNGIFKNESINSRNSRNIRLAYTIKVS